MTNLLFIIASIGFGLWALRNILFWVGLWQDKEYRKDRLAVHILETIQGRLLFFSPLNIAKLLLIGVYIATIFIDRTTWVFDMLVTCLYLYEGIFVLKQVALHRLKRPYFTSKASILVLLAICIILLFYFIPMTESYLWLLLLDRLIFFIISFLIFCLSFPTEIYKDIQIQKAKDTMRRYQNIKIIAVSGSYGKTSTKEYIAQILAKKYHVVKTPGSTNTAIGIAKVILQKIHADTEIFIVEIGAYKRGEIAEIMDMVCPSVSVTTGISDQHISLYGSLQNVLESEYELVRALPKDGLALFNLNSQFIEKLYNKTKVKKMYYYTKYQSSPSKRDISIVATDITSSPKNITFTTQLGKQKVPFPAPIIGQHSVQNILPGVYLAYLFGIDQKIIQKAVAALTPAPQTMERKERQDGSIAVDDTFNASPESVLAAMDYINLYKKKKVFVLSPLIELGREAKKRHFIIGQKAGKTCDYLFLLNKNFSKEISKGAMESNGTCKIIIENALDTAKEIKKLIQKGDVIVCEGKEAKTVLKKLYE